MASIIKKKKGNSVYYYAAQCRRVNGKPRIVWQKYLGKLEDIIDKIDGVKYRPMSAEVFRFGSVAALYNVAERLKLVDTIDGIVPKRKQGGTVGEYILIAAINRAVEPKSKAQIGDWFEGTALRRFMPNIKKRNLKSQRFWDHMSYLDKESIRKIECKLTQHMVKEFDMNLRALIYDTTNFISYIDSSNPSELAQRGKSKVGRGDLKQIGLALMVTSDFRIPLFHEVYPGNRNDSKEFGSITDELIERYKILSSHCEEITIVFDKGNNAEKHMKDMDGSPYEIVGSLVPSQQKELLSIPLEEFKELDGEYAGHRVYRTTKKVLGAERTVVVTYNDTLYLGQLQGMSTKIKKATQALRQISTQLGKRRRGEITKGRPPKMKSVKKRVDQILKKEHLSELIHVELTEKGGLPDLSFNLDHEALRELQEERFGKTILFCTNNTWSSREILAAYRGQYHVENAFKQLKDPHFVSWAPMFHWTDQKIRVHAFYCVLSLTLSSLLLREIYRKCEQEGEAVVTTSIADLMQTLDEIKEVAHIYPDDSKTKDHITLSRMTLKQKKLYDMLNLDSMAPW